MFLFVSSSSFLFLLFLTALIRSSFFLLLLSNNLLISISTFSIWLIFTSVLFLSILFYFLVYLVFSFFFPIGLDVFPPSFVRLGEIVLLPHVPLQAERMKMKCVMFSFSLILLYLSSLSVGNQVLTTYVSFSFSCVSLGIVF